MTMLFQGVSSFFFTLATPFSLLFLLVGINALAVIMLTTLHTLQNSVWLAHKLLEYLIDARMSPVQTEVLRTSSIGMYQQNILLNTAIQQLAGRFTSKPTT